MTKYSKGDYTNCRCNICEIVDEDDEIVCNVVTEDFEKVVAILEENEQLKQELFESEKEHLIETYADNSVRKNDKIHSLKKEFKERFGRDFE